MLELFDCESYFRTCPVFTAVASGRQIARFVLPTIHRSVCHCFSQILSIFVHSAVGLLHFRDKIRLSRILTEIFDYLEFVRHKIRLRC